MAKIRLSKSGIKYVFSSVCAWVVDNGLYMLLFSLLGAGLSPVAQVIARVISSVFNFNMNNFFVFNNKTSKAEYWKAFGKYYCVCIPQTLISVGLLSWIVSRMETISVYAADLVKIAIEAALFVISYFIQKKWVFHKNTEKNTEL